MKKFLSCLVSLTFLASAPAAFADNSCTSAKDKRGCNSAGSKQHECKWDEDNNACRTNCRVFSKGDGLHADKGNLKPNEHELKSDCKARGDCTWNDKTKKCSDK